MQLSSSDLSDLNALERTIHEGQKTFISVGLALAEIQKRKLYLQYFDTFEDYCLNKFGWTKQRAYQILNSAQVVDDLSPKSQPLVDSERVARQLSEVPKEKREEVLKKAAKAGKVTAKSIAQIASSLPEPPSDESEKPLRLEPDETGYPIPQKGMVIWNRRGEIKDILRIISDARSTLKKYEGAEDILFKTIPAQGIVSLLDNAYSELKTVVPYAVCPYCSGQVPENCMVCKGVGFLGKFTWDMAVPMELKEIRRRVVEEKAA